MRIRNHIDSAEKFAHEALIEFREDHYERASLLQDFADLHLYLADIKMKFADKYEDTKEEGNKPTTVNVFTPEFSEEIKRKIDQAIRTIENRKTRKQ